MYSVEEDEEEASSGSRSTSTEYKHFVEEVLRAVDAAADFEDAQAHVGRQGRSTWVAVKMVAAFIPVCVWLTLNSQLADRPPCQYQ